MSNSIVWQDGVPTSPIYDDIYFSTENGLQETNHVFIDGNNLRNRWAQQKGAFNIIETGFGTGLNFFAAWKLWQEIAGDYELHFTSIEKYPLSIDDIRKAITLWPEFNGLLEEFALQYPQNPHGEFTAIFGDSKVHLKIIFEDVSPALEALDIPADAWFLDGFSPAKNPDMWNDILYKNMARLTSNGGTFATFTASGNVRRGLQDNGFIVNKSPGFGQKRHILVGTIAPAIS